MNLAKLETLLGHRFEKPELLERAVTHRSWAHERLKREAEEMIRGAENELLEFLGDSVLGLVIAEHLFAKNPSAAEGDLTLMKHRLVSTANLFLRLALQPLVGPRAVCHCPLEQFRLLKPMSE